MFDFSFRRMHALFGFGVAQRMARRRNGFTYCLKHRPLLLLAALSGALVGAHLLFACSTPDLFRGDDYVAMLLTPLIHVNAQKACFFETPIEEQHECRFVKREY